MTIRRMFEIHCIFLDVIPAKPAQRARAGIQSFLWALEPFILTLSKENDSSGQACRTHESTVGATFTPINDA